MVVTEAASDINENQRKGGGRAQADVLNIGIRTKERVTRIVVPSARATKCFFWRLSENSHSQVEHSFALVGG